MIGLKYFKYFFRIIRNSYNWIFHIHIIWLSFGISTMLKMISTSMLFICFLNKIVTYDIITYWCKNRKKVTLFFNVFCAFLFPLSATRVVGNFLYNSEPFYIFCLTFYKARDRSINIFILSSSKITPDAKIHFFADFCSIECKIKVVIT